MPSASDSPDGWATQPPTDTLGAPASSHSFLEPPDRPGCLGRLAGCRVIEELGAGGMGIVFLAEDPVLDRRVAIKVMRPEFAARADARQRFLREAKAAAALEHDHVVPIYQVGETGAVPYIVMPFLAGRSLSARLKHDGRLPIGEVLRIGREVAQGLAAAHGAGLIHRDIKPDNIWLYEPPQGDPAAPRGQVKILDFGLARPVAADDSELTQPGALLGTPAYMAPEQADGKPVDARADLFSLGCVLYQMATGRPPFQGPALGAILRALATEQPPAPRALRPELPQALSDLILQLLEKCPEQRPPSARAVADRCRAIEGFDRSSPSESPPEQTLAQRLERGPLTVVEALTAGKQILEALAAVHERGIIHRELRPGNVMLARDGTAKVRDPGLVRHDPQEAGPTRSGTLDTAYLAPEQVRGLPPERRCDLWAFGCVLFEALTGKRAFAAATPSSLRDTILEQPPDWQSLPAGLPVRAGALLRRCLHKDPYQRQRDAGDARLEIEEILDELKRGAPLRPGALQWSRLVWALAAIALAAAAFALGKWGFGPGTGPGSATSANGTEAAPAWTGEVLLRGAAPAYLPRVSPDGQWLAFIVVQEGQSQVGVMKLDSGEWWVLTRSRERGQVNNIAWSLDSKRLYFDRFTSVPAGIFSASPLDRAAAGARELPVIAAADNPQVAADGSLIVCMLDENGNCRLHRSMPGETPRPLGPAIELERGWPAPIRACHTRNEVIFCGKILDGKAPRARRFYLLNLDTNEYRPLAEARVGMEFVPLAISWRDDFLYTVSAAADAYHYVRIPLAGNPTPQVLLTLRTETHSMDVDADGRLYLDQPQRPLEVIRFGLPANGAPPAAAPLDVERLAGPLVWRETATIDFPLELPDGSLVLTTKVAGLDRLVTAIPGQDPVPLLHNSNEETARPTALLGSDRLAFVVGSGSRRRLRIATLEEGHVRLQPTALGVDCEELDALAGAPDGKTLYFVQSRQVFAVPADGSRAPQRIAAGDGVAVDPRSGGLLIQRFDNRGGHLFRLPRPGAAAEEMPIDGPLRLAPVALSASAIGRDGRVLVTVAPKDTLFWRPALLDPEGKLQLLPVRFEGDVVPTAWSKDGKILASGYALRGELWRFTPRASRNTPP